MVQDEAAIVQGDDPVRVNSGGNTAPGSSHETSLPMDPYLEQHTSELMILILASMVLGTLLLLVPQLIKWNSHALDMQHTERMRALEQGQALPKDDFRALLAGRTAFLVPMVVICVAGTVTCFLAAYRTDTVFNVSLVVWSVAGVASLAAITGGVALMGRLAQLDKGVLEDEVPENPLDEKA
jgi:hypothetical protein